MLQTVIAFYNYLQPFAALAHLLRQSKSGWNYSKLKPGHVLKVYDVIMAYRAIQNWTSPKVAWIIVIVQFFFTLGLDS